MGLLLGHRSSLTTMRNYCELGVRPAARQYGEGMCWVGILDSLPGHRTAGRNRVKALQRAQVRVGNGANEPVRLAAVIVQAAAIVVTAAFAVFGLRAWRKQLIGKRKVEIAEETLVSRRTRSGTPWHTRVCPSTALPKDCPDRANG